MTETKLYLITEDELMKIRHDCIHYVKNLENDEGCPDGCPYTDEEYGCNFDAEEIVKIVLSRVEDDIDSWCKIHEEVLKDIRTESYRSGYHDGGVVGRERAINDVRDAIAADMVKGTGATVSCIRLSYILSDLRTQE